MSARKLRIKDCRGLSSFRGMMFSRKDGALLSKPLYSSGINIWMPFVPALDLYFLSADYKILKKQKAHPLTPDPGTWKLYSCDKAHYCLEIKSSLGMKLSQQDINKIVNGLEKN